MLSLENELSPQPTAPHCWEERVPGLLWTREPCIVAGAPSQPGSTAYAPVFKGPCFSPRLPIIPAGPALPHLAPCLHVPSPYEGSFSPAKHRGD